MLPQSRATLLYVTYKIYWDPKNLEFKIMFDFHFFGFNLLNNLIHVSNLLITVEILGNYDTKTNQWVLTPKQLNLVGIGIGICTGIGISKGIISDFHL